MTPRESLLRLYRRRGSEQAPFSFNLCPDLERQFRARHPHLIEAYVQAGREFAPPPREAL